MNSRYRPRQPVSASYLPGHITKPGIVIGHVEYGKFYLASELILGFITLFVPFFWPFLAFQIWYEIRNQKEGAACKARWRDKQEIAALKANQAPQPRPRPSASTWTH